MFATDVAMPTPTGIAYGSQKAIDALTANPANAGAKVTWTPARVGLSGDGMHGFTAGFMTITRADGAVNPAKYLAYWEKQNGGWRVLAYKRTPAKAAAPSVTVSYLLPKQVTPAKHDAAAIEKNRESLADAERSFSRDAQTMGIGEAFKKYGSPDAINLAGPDTLTFIMGNTAIGENVGSGQAPNTSSVNWGPEKTIHRGERRFRCDDRLHRSQQAGRRWEDPAGAGVLHDLAARPHRCVALRRGVAERLSRDASSALRRGRGISGRHGTTRAIRTTRSGCPARDIR